MATIDSRWLDERIPLTLPTIKIIAIEAYKKALSGSSGSDPNAITASSTITANYVVIGDDGVRGVKVGPPIGETGNTTIIKTTSGGLLNPAILPVPAANVKGAVALPVSSTGTFYKDDGTWATAGGGITSVDHGDSDYTPIDDGYTQVRQSAAFTTQRTWTLPAPTNGRDITLLLLSSATTFPLKVVSISGTIGGRSEIALIEGVWPFRGDGTDWRLIGGDDIWIPKGKSFQYGLKPPIVKNAMDDDHLGRTGESFGTTVGTMWTGVNVGNLTSTVRDGVRRIYLPSDSSAQLHGYLQDISGDGTWEMAFGVAASQVTSRYGLVHMVIANSKTSTTSIGFDVGYGPSGMIVEVYNFTNWTTRGSSLLSTALSPVAEFDTLRINRTTTLGNSVYKFYTVRSGFPILRYTSGALNNITAIGWAGQAEAGDLWADVYYFRKTA